MHKTIIRIFIILTFFLNVTHSQQFNEIGESGLNYYGNITAPDFPKDLQWLNTEMPYSISDFKGKLVLLDFWTYCCINCIHIIPDLKKLEEMYKNELVVIGVHSAKFLTERGTENIRQAILRYEIEHPVVNDKDFEVWESYTARAWPTLVLIDPKGKVIGMTTGEGAYDTFNPVISEAIDQYERDGLILNLDPLKLALEKNKTPKSLLSFPGKVAADTASSRLFITDSNNNRVLILKINENGNEAVVEEVIGTGKIGTKDGAYNEAEFFRPQGIAFHKDKLYIADTENHLIRAIDLLSMQVKTVAGLGYQSREYGIIKGRALETALNSPWDLIAVNDVLYIAMAGSHQIWKLDLATGQIGTYAGSGRENIIDGALYESSLAQPSGITTDGVKLYFADSEVSAIRSAELKSKGIVNTIVGTGLFDFGDIDGAGDNVRLQHPLGVVFNKADQLLYITDTYNSKIKTVNPLTREVKTYAGTGFTGTRDGSIESAQFNEPSGLTIMNGKIFVTDTNNNLLRVIDMVSKEVKTVRITNPDKLMAGMKSDKKRKAENTVMLSPVELKSGEIKLKFNFTLPEGFKINPEAMPQVAVNGDAVEQFETEVNTKSAVFEVPVKLNGAGGKLNVEVLVYYCETENQGICKFKDLYFEVPVSINASGKDVIDIVYTLN
ncbi:MAG: redoxin domain-containing protein [Chlorobi bacterium]|nr:redoxin domain-containing protein [Chlorobiota bacterium]MCI0716965.1 redoxin domain-containing protein [Chlorobiota bacterium]